MDLGPTAVRQWAFAQANNKADMDIESKHPQSRGIETDPCNVASPGPACRTILIVDRDVASRDLLARVLRAAGFECFNAGDTFKATLSLDAQLPDAIVLDGTELLPMLKEQRRTRDIPIILVSATATEQERIDGLDRGADDFIEKPFSTVEFLARLRAVLRRRARQARLSDPDALDHRTVIEYGGLRLDPLTHRVSTGRDKYVRLGSTEFRLLRYFLRHPERVHTRDELLEELRGPNPAIDSRTVDTYIRRVRQALEPHGCHTFIRTVHGMGYRFSVPPDGP